MKFEISGKAPRRELLFSSPVHGEVEKAYETVAETCKERAREEFGMIMDPALKSELDLIKKTGAALSYAFAAEIAKLSEEAGYPLYTPDGAPLVSFLLGISGVSPERFNFSETPSRYWSAQCKVRGSDAFELHVAQSVLERVTDRLEERFANVRTFGSEKKTAFKILSVGDLETIGKLALETGRDLRKTDFRSQQVGKEVVADICLSDRGWNPGSDPYVEFDDAAAYYGYSMCNPLSRIRNQKMFEAVGIFVFRDEVFDRLVRFGIGEKKAYDISRLWTRDEKRDEEIAMIEAFGAPGEMIASFRFLFNLWDKAACLAHIDVLGMLKYYEMRFPKEYERIAEKRR